MKIAWPLVLVAVVAACGSEGGTTGSSSSGGTGASSTGGTSAGGTSTGGATVGGAGSGGGGTTATGGGGSSIGGTGGVDAGPVIPGGPCVEPIAAPPAKPCVQGEPKQSYCKSSSPSELIMATCASSGETQCDAASACAPGWHFCTGTEYLDRGGRTVPKTDTIIYAWVAACVRDTTGSEYHDGPCSVCETDVGAPPGMIYGCNGETISPGMIDDTIGAMADTACHRIGENIPALTGYWSINWSQHMAGHTVCCIDGA